MYIAKINILPHIRAEYGTKIDDSTYHLLSEIDKKFYHPLIEQESLGHIKDQIDE